MRDAFFDELRLLFLEDRRVVFMTGDLGYKLFAPLIAIDPARVINYGIREGAMVGFAAGLSKMGFIPFVYSIVPFLTLRCLEQIKLDLCYNMCRVILVGVGGGYSYGSNGPTHHGVEDIAVLSTFPNMRCWTPATPTGVRQCVRSVTAISSPAYIRLGRNGEPEHANVQPTEDLPLVVRDGSDGVIIALGTILDEVLSAAHKLGTIGLRPRVVLVSSIKPFPEAALLSLLAAGKPVLTVEEHVVTGGLGQQLGFAIAKSRCAVVFDAATAPDLFPDVCMTRSASLSWGSLDSDSIVARFLYLHSTGHGA